MRQSGDEKGHVPAQRRYGPAAPQSGPLKAAGQERGTNPEPGLFRVRLVRGGPYVAAEIRHEPPKDPVTKEFLERSFYWYAVINGEAEAARGIQPTHKVEQIWLFGEKIDREMYEWLRADRAWARSWAPGSAEANPRKAIDLGKEPVVF
jgi:hypothetical protein